VYLLRRSYIYFVTFQEMKLNEIDYLNDSEGFLLPVCSHRCHQTKTTSKMESLKER